MPTYIAHIILGENWNNLIQIVEFSNLPSPLPRKNICSYAPDRWAKWEMFKLTISNPTQEVRFPTVKK